MGGGTGHTHLETVCPLDRTGSPGRRAYVLRKGAIRSHSKVDFQMRVPWGMGGCGRAPSSGTAGQFTKWRRIASKVWQPSSMKDAPTCTCFPGRTCLGMHCTARGVSLFGRVKTTDILKSSLASHGKSRGAATQIPPSEISCTIPACTAPSGPLTSAGVEIVFRG